MCPVREGLDRLRARFHDLGVWEVPGGEVARVREGKSMVSEELSGSQATDLWVSRFHGAALGVPHSPSQRPDPVFIAWHRREVFRAPARYL